MGQCAEHKDAKKDKKIILLIDTVNYIMFHLQKQQRRLGTICLKLFKIQHGQKEWVCLLNTTHKLSSVGMEVSEEWVGSLWQAYLIIGLESSGVAITGDMIKTKFLQDVKHSKHDNSTVLYSESFGSGHRKFNYGHDGKNKSLVRCFTCIKYGHYAQNCDKNKNGDVALYSALSMNFTSESSYSANSDVWYLDSAESVHMTNNLGILRNIEEIPQPQCISTANNQVMTSNKVGSVFLSKTSSRVAEIKNVIK